MISMILIAVLIEGLAALWALKWALPRSNQAFFSVFVGDALLRLVGLGFMAWWLAAKQLPFVGPLLAIGFGYFVMSLIQIPLFYKAR